MEQVRQAWFCTPFGRYLIRALKRSMISMLPSLRDGYQSKTKTHSTRYAGIGYDNSPSLPTTGQHLSKRQSPNPNPQPPRL